MGEVREPTECPKCHETCTYDGWDHVHRNGLGIGSCSPTAQPAPSGAAAGSGDPDPLARP